MKKILIVSSLCLFFVFNILCFSNKNIVVNAEEIYSNAKSMVVIEQDSNRILYEKNCNKQLPMASTTKIVTALTVLNNCKNIDEDVKINDNAIGIEGTSIYLKKGEILTVRELLYGLILASGNDCASALAYHIGGNINNFCRMMNLTARNCGAVNTNFVNPHGLDEKGHYTTALDLAKITAEALKNKDFYQIVNTKNIRIKGNDINNKYRYLKNKNKLLWTNEFCNGVKTGFTDNAGRCIVGSAKKNGMTIISVVFNCIPMFEETNKLFNLAFDNYELVELLKPYNYLKQIKVNNGKNDFVKLYTKKGFSYPLTKKEKNNISINIELPEKINAPLKKEEMIGDLKIYMKNNLLFSEKIYTMESVKSINFYDNLKTIINKWKK